MKSSTLVILIGACVFVFLLMGGVVLIIKSPVELIIKSPVEHTNQTSFSPTGATTLATSIGQYIGEKDQWKPAYMTAYTSYPTVGSKECIDFSGCKYEGQFSYLDTNLTKEEVAQQRIVSTYTLPEKDGSKLGCKCIEIRDPRNKTKSFVVYALDTCADKDTPDNQCTTNATSGGGTLLDVERNAIEQFMGKKYDDEFNGLDLNRVEYRIVKGPCYTGPGTCRVK